MKKILIAVDGSDAALHAVDLGGRLARSTGAEVTMAFVVPPVFVPPEVPFGVMPMTEEAIKAGNEVLATAAKRIALLSVKTTTLIGGPAERISELAEAENFDLVLVGSKGRGAVARMLIGSVTDRLVHICPKPVLVVR